MTQLRLGLTMRSSSTPTEERDCLATDWPEYLARYLPQASYLFLPSLGQESVNYARAEGVNTLILTGGNDIGSCQRRDSSESALLSWALASNLRVLGVCRGMQVLCHFLGGKLSPVEGHVATPHPLSWQIQVPYPQAEVNSFHNHGVTEVPESLQVLARASDQSIEAVRIPDHPVYGLMWHPERPLSEDGRLLTNWLLEKVFGPLPEKRGRCRV